MKYISLTFDDGREDNYSVAFPILQQMGFAATIYCTTGFVDGTWEKKEDWYSAEKALTIDQLRALQSCGWEIALHGDKHITEVEDSKVAIQKLRDWGILRKPTGMSLPDSKNESGLKDVINRYYPTDVSYVRGGRARDTKKVSSKILFALYTFLKIQKAYNVFNAPNITKVGKEKPQIVSSVVVRLSDNPRMISRFIEKMPDGAWIPIMLHSIHPDDKVYLNDPWNWQESKFKKLCKELVHMKEKGLVEVLPMVEVIKSFDEKKEDKGRGCENERD